jgi:hypothetical protein
MRSPIGTRFAGIASESDDDLTALGPEQIAGGEGRDLRLIDP